MKKWIAMVFLVGMSSIGAAQSDQGNPPVCTWLYPEGATLTYHCDESQFNIPWVPDHPLVEIQPQIGDYYRYYYASEGPEVAFMQGLRLYIISPSGEHLMECWGPGSAPKTYTDCRISGGHTLAEAMTIVGREIRNQQDAAEAALAESYKALLERDAR